MARVILSSVGPITAIAVKIYKEVPLVKILK